ncbi:MAG: hypothetical protein H8E79_09130 [Desulfobulbaceae bacterium]|uniref:Uncharacterized protein n=1 Tax=Candidatus Desulfatifera sulfidica TaxID=2841691 RepID=A0A8J6NAM7_9BACT|nr:hypothetical protein [Candidatus Desulfatifera sulfidica]
MTTQNTASNQTLTIREFISQHGKQISEGFWFILALTLFVFLGPFAAPIAIIAIYSLRQSQGEAPEPELATQKAKSNHTL